MTSTYPYNLPLTHTGGLASEDDCQRKRFLHLKHAKQVPPIISIFQSSVKQYSGSVCCSDPPTICHRPTGSNSDPISDKSLAVTRYVGSTDARQELKQVTRRSLCPEMSIQCQTKIAQMEVKACQCSDDMTHRPELCLQKHLLLKKCEARIKGEEMPIAK